MTTPFTARRPSWLIAPLLCAALLSGCSSDAPDASGSPTPGATADAPSPTPSAPVSGPEAAPAASADPAGPEGSFRTWLAASRAPDAATACDHMTPELTQRMLDQLTAQGVPGVTDCASLITMTAALFAAAGQPPEAVVEVREESADRAVLHVTYAAGSCGLVVLRPGPGHWLLDERSQEEC
ncbi:hypothetical protein H9657_04770 [Cellulomonas sp. Sa3CUA2]|uniref:Lipoprotein n=1 Tax=Cellulomonas avistercoris TaxID=2762242 RepID=A0ABR8QAY6_9CELL|nr:hypothetical protein [Cellulomonas avistercoris]MBD7917592.1 hypothetical protein [Cellulomonas avistercoris]